MGGARVDDGSCAALLDVRHFPGPWRSRRGTHTVAFESINEGPGPGRMIFILGGVVLVYVRSVGAGAKGNNPSPTFPYCVIVAGK